MVKKVVPYVLNGRLRTVVGQDHHSAKLTDAQVETIRRIYEAKLGGYRKIAQWISATYGIDVHWVTVRDIVQYRRRACTPDGYMTLRRDVVEVSSREPDTSRIALEQFLNDIE